MQLRRRSGVPLYRQMESALLKQIDSGDLAPGDRLPTEIELAQQWQVNRLTVRQAIGELVRAGRVIILRGNGTYVADPPVLVEIDLPPLPTTEAETSSSAALARQGHMLQERVTSVQADDLRAATEALNKPAELLRIDSVHTDLGTPCVVSNCWVDGARFPGMAEIAVGETPVYRLLRDHYGVRLRYAWRTLVATSASAADADVLDIPAGSPMMLREGLNVDDEGEPTLYLSRRERGDRVKYVLRYDTRNG
ncbi:GntR family transcriptional regulator [Nocardia sp. NPDC058379]|uniref:GntR family transcriptional regulator n=1 Tax=unclassified Nocardia TaxID=2637762 RepID=UPI0036551B69